MRITTSVIGAIALAAIALPAGAQARARSETRTESDERGRRVLVRSMEERAVLGVHTASGGERDTLGLLVTGITPGGPAEKAGLEEGNRIAAVNGTSLRLSAADAGEPDMRGLMTRRLMRELSKVKPGDEVELRVWANGQFRTMRVKTAAAEELTPARTRVTRDELDDRAVIGVSASATGSARDTLGLMVMSVAEGGPAERAGIFEGARIMSINGVDLRVAREDAGDHAVGSARQSRFTREMRKAQVGQDVELRVYGDGQVRTVRVKPARAGDVYKNQRGSRAFHFGEMMPAMPPMPPLPGMRGDVRSLQLRAPRVAPAPHPGVFHLELEGDVERAVEGALSELEAVLAPHGEAHEERHELHRDDDAPAVAPAPSRRAPSPAAVRAPAAVHLIQAGWSPSAAPVAVVAASPSAARTLVMPGLRASTMSPDLAAYFGESVGDGLLVLEAEGPFDVLRVGDVIVAVNGRPVVSGETISVSLDRGRENVVTVVRKGKREHVVVRGA